MAALVQEGKRKMKLWIAAAAALLAAGCLLAGGCGKEAPEAGSSSEGHVHIVTHANWNPFEYLKDGKIAGFDIDLIEEASKRAGLTPDITDAGWEAILSRSARDRRMPLFLGLLSLMTGRRLIFFPNLILCPGRRSWCGRILIFPVRRI